MEKITIRTNYVVACNLMNSLYTLYMAIVDSMGGDPDDPNIRKEGETYARKKFIELADEFENTLPMQWAWVSDKEGEE